MSSQYASSLCFLLVVCLWGGHDAMDVNANAGRMCYSCEGINCQRTTKLNQTVQCGDLLDTCVTIFDKYAVVARGCYSDMTAAMRTRCEDKDNIECQKCFGQLCNDKGRADQQCITCNSNTDAKCATGADSIQATQCGVPTAMLSYCYVRNNGKDGTSRGCYVHQRDQIECLRDSDCALCLLSGDSACNTYALSVESSAERLLELPRLLLGAVIVCAYSIIF